MTSYLQHTFNFPNFVHVQQLAKSTFPEEGGAAGLLGVPETAVDIQ